MRTAPTTRRLAVVAVSALALGGLAACGDDDDGNGSAASFCDDVTTVDEAFSTLDEDISDPSQFGEIFSEVEASLAGIDPPGESADDWDTLTEALAAVVDVVEDVDFEDPEALAALGEELEGLEERFGDVEAASDRIEAFTEEECGVDLGD
jgi:hypothetical protein